jgi:hypothetical protein
LSQNIEGLANVTFIEVINEIFKNCIPVFIVGGAVRDVVDRVENGFENDLKTIIDSIKDIDLGFGECAENVYDLAQRKNWLCSKSNSGLLSFGNTQATLFLEGKSICGLNGDINKIYPKNPDCIGTNLYYDLICRDFIINSLCYDPINKTVVDASGTGLDDIRKKILRIPVPKENWENWVKGNQTKLIRYFKFIARDYKPADNETRDFIIRRAKEYGSKDKKKGLSDCDLQLRIGIMNRRNDETSKEKTRKFRDAVIADMGKEWCYTWFPGLQKEYV